jgi:benzoate membrane transport protein
MDDPMIRFFALPHIASGFVAMLVGYTSAAAIVFQAAISSGADADKIASWMWAVGVGMGVCGIAMSLRFKAPIIVAWSTPGAALLVTSLPGIPMGDAVGAFLFSSALLTLCGVTGWFEKIMQIIPPSLGAAMLAGVLLRFGLNAFSSMETAFEMVALMLFTYILGKHYLPRYVIPTTFIVGVGYAALTGQIHVTGIELSPTLPVWTTPSFSISTLIGVGLPLFIVTMASQNIPGIATLRAHGYKTPASPLISWTGITGFILAPFGGFAFNLGAITAAICMSKETDPDPTKRYYATIWAGIFCVLMGIFGATVTSLFTLFPAELIMAIAGLALIGTISNSLHTALASEAEREAAFITFAITASGVTLLTIGAPFWGILAGLMVHYFNSYRQKKQAQI